MLGDFGEFVAVEMGAVFAFGAFEGEDVSGVGGDEVCVDDVFALAGEDDGDAVLVLVGVCVFDDGDLVGVECERVVLDVFKGGVCVQGDAGAVFVEVFEVLHWVSLSSGGGGLELFLSTSYKYGITLKTMRATLGVFVFVKSDSASYWGIRLWMR